MSFLNFLFGYILGRSYKQSARQPDPIPQKTLFELFPASAFELVDETIYYDDTLDPEQVMKLVENLHHDPRLQEILAPSYNDFESSFDSYGDANYDPYDASCDYPYSLGGDSFGGDGGGE